MHISYYSFALQITWPYLQGFSWLLFLSIAHLIDGYLLQSRWSAKVKDGSVLACPYTAFWIKPVTFWHRGGPRCRQKLNEPKFIKGQSAGRGHAQKRHSGGIKGKAAIKVGESTPRESKKYENQEDKIKTRKQKDTTLKKYLKIQTTSNTSAGNRLGCQEGNNTDKLARGACERQA